VKGSKASSRPIVAQEKAFNPMANASLRELAEERKQAINSKALQAGIAGLGSPINAAEIARPKQEATEKLYHEREARAQAMAMAEREAEEAAAAAEQAIAAKYRLQPPK
jgi:hypothetical protein